MSVRSGSRPGLDAILTRGWLPANKWLLLRRLSQVTMLLLFLAGPWWDIWIVEGNLASSLTLDTIPLTDPYALLQTVVAGHLPETTALLGALLVLALYALVGGRAYCSWVCPLNPVTDLAHWLRQRLGLQGGLRLSRRSRYAVLATTLVVAAITGSLMWELVNPVSMLHRGLLFGFGAGWIMVLSVFLFDLLSARRGWCGRLCPVGAFYSLINTVALLRVRAPALERCNDCMDCYAVCPEPEVLKPVLQGRERRRVINSIACTNCGRCIDVCSQQVFRFGTRFAESADQRSDNPQVPGVEVSK